MALQAAGQAPGDISGKGEGLWKAAQAGPQRARSSWGFQRLRALTGGTWQDT